MYATLSKHFLSKKINVQTLYQFFLYYRYYHQPPLIFNMKKTTSSVLFVFISTILFSQNVKKIEGLKDAWDLTYSYTGEVKDGKPNGMGVAKYASGNVLRYVGSFVNGMYTGKGTMFFDDGAFLTGEWKNGKLNGKGTNLTSNGNLYIGEFANGVKSGKGTLFNKDNSVVIGRFANDKIYHHHIKVR